MLSRHLRVGLLCRLLVRLPALCLCLVPVRTPAQMPSNDEMVQATLSAEPLARHAGITLRMGTLWLAALRERAPLVVAFGRGVCQLGYSAYTPGRDYRWLFPALPPAQRALWLAGVVQHELAHCLAQAESAERPGTALALAEGAVHGAPHSARWHEVLGDLAFALHVDRQSPEGADLVRQLARLRADQRASDPAHDTSAELLCYLGLPEKPLPQQLWLTSLQQLRARCWQASTTGLPTDTASSRR